MNLLISHPRRTPLNLPGATACKSYMPLSQRVLLAAIMGKTGGGPDVSLSGGLTALRNWEIEITTNGNETGAIFRWRVDGGAWTSGVTAGASVALGSTGTSASFAAGSYTTSHAYRGVIESLTDHQGHVFGSVGGSPNRVWVSQDGLNGRPGFESDGVARCIFSGVSDGLATSLMGGDDTAFMAYVPLKYTGSLTPSPNARLWCIGGDITDQSFFAVSVSTAGNWRLSKRGTSGGTAGTDGSAADNNFHVMKVKHTGTSATLVDLASGTTLVTSSQNVPTCNVAAVAFGRVQTLSVDEFGAGIYGLATAYSGTLSAEAEAYLDRWYRNTYGV